jgi:hypothetical protein
MLTDTRPAPGRRKPFASRMVRITLQRRWRCWPPTVPAPSTQEEEREAQAVPAAVRTRRAAATVIPEKQSASESAQRPAPGCSS